MSSFFATDCPPLAPSVVEAFCTELADLAYDLEKQGRLDGADVAMMLRARLCEIAAETAASRSAPVESFNLNSSQP
jgi:hypothetical protein